MWHLQIRPGRQSRQTFIMRSYHPPILWTLQDELDKLMANLQTLKQRKACSVSSTMASRIAAIQEAFRWANATCNPLFIR